MASDIILPFTHARSESINADSLNSNFLQLGRSGGRPQRAVHPRRLPVNTVIHTTLVGLEPATFRSLVDCWTPTRYQQCHRLTKVQQTKLLAQYTELVFCILCYQLSEHASRLRNSIGIHFTMQCTVCLSVCLRRYHDHIGWNRFVYYDMRS